VNIIDIADKNYIYIVLNVTLLWRTLKEEMREGQTNEQKIKKWILRFQKNVVSIKTVLNFGYWCNGTESFVLVLEIL